MSDNSLATIIMSWFTGELGRTYAWQIQILQWGKLSCRYQHLVVCGLGLLCSSHHRRQAPKGTKKLPKNRQLVFGWAYSRIASIIMPPTINVNPNSWLGVGSAWPRNMRLRSTENTTSMDWVASTAANSRILCDASWVALKKSTVAITPEDKATTKVLMT